MIVAVDCTGNDWSVTSRFRVRKRKENLFVFFFFVKIFWLALLFFSGMPGVEISFFIVSSFFRFRGAALEHRTKRSEARVQRTHKGRGLSGLQRLIVRLSVASRSRLRLAVFRTAVTACYESERWTVEEVRLSLYSGGKTLLHSLSMLSCSMSMVKFVRQQAVICNGKPLRVRGCGAFGSKGTIK